MTKKTIFCWGAGILVAALCLAFFLGVSAYKNNIIQQAKTMLDTELTVSAVDDNTLRVENLVGGYGVTYCWNVVSDWNGDAYTYVYPAYSQENYIEFHYEDLSNVKVRPFVAFEGIAYRGLSYAVQADFSLERAEENDFRTVKEIETVTREVGDVVSLAYVAFLLVTALAYYLVPKKIQWVVLLVASLFFYLVADVNYIIFLVFSATTAYFVAKTMTKNRQANERLVGEAADKSAVKALKAQLKSQNKFCLMLGLIATVGVLVVIKYTNFITANVGGLLGVEIPFVELLMPLGLSFYTFMLVGYLVDVYRGKYPAEANFFRFFLFASFFPHVSQGPIARYDQLAPNLKAHHSFDYTSFCRGCQRILWGFFLKLVLTDRLAVVVNDVYSQYTEMSYLMIGFAMVVYSLQIYGDFYSSMEIAIGSAELFGIHLKENFLRPNFATTMPEFWRRWHVSLGEWFKDYVFYSVSTSKSMMKLNTKVRKACTPAVTRGLMAVPPIFMVWLLTGLWHGSSWNFVAWGLFHGVLIWLSATFGQSFTKGLEKLGIKTQSWDYKVFQMLKVYGLCTVGRVFFRTDSMATAVDMLRRVVTFQMPGYLTSFSSIDLAQSDYILMAIGLVLLFIVGVLQEKIGSVRQVIANANIWIRWPIWLFLIGVTLAFGIYGQGTVTAFVYGNF